MMHMPNNGTLIRVWAAIRSIAEMLCRCEGWPRFVPDKGYAEKAAEWRGKLEEEGTKGPEKTSRNQNAETPK